MCPTPCHVICLLIPILRSWKQDINKKKLKGLKVNGKTRKPRFLKNHPLAVTLPSQSQFGHSKLTRKSHDKLTTWSRHHFPNPRILIVAKCTGYTSKLRGRGHPVNSWKHLLSVCLSGGHDQVMWPFTAYFFAKEAASHCKQYLLWTYLYIYIYKITFHFLFFHKYVYEKKKLAVGVSVSQVNSCLHFWELLPKCSPSSPTGLNCFHFSSNF